MKLLHAPKIDARYWTAIFLASVFGTNMGDLYAHEFRLGIVKGLVVLAVFAAIVFAVERFENKRHEIYYWLVIVIIRTGATNIADYLAYRVRVPELQLTVGLAALIALFAWLSHGFNSTPDVVKGQPRTNAGYWLAMLSAGVFGTVLGDICEHRIGEGIAAVLLTAVFLGVLALVRGRAAQLLALYWLVVAVARTAGTAVGDWLAENKVIHLGLPLSTALSAVAFVAVLVFWRISEPTLSAQEVTT